jgi:hypothetical protein
MLHQLQGKTQTELETLQIELACAYFANDVSEAKRDEIEKTCKAVNSCLPASFVLADLFDVESMTLDIPLEVYEADVSIGFISCPDCEGEGWIEVDGSAWYNRAWALHTFTSMKPCTTCHCEGVVLTTLEPVQDVPDNGLVLLPFYSPVTNNPWLLAA